MIVDHLLNFSDNNDGLLAYGPTTMQVCSVTFEDNHICFLI